ncbi:PLP-dependent aminotransferase family protein [Paenibacillus sp. YSY-4.3]
MRNSMDSTPFSKSPVYMTVYEAIKQDIVEGRLHANDRLPSIREQAKQLCISATPVETAYQQLIAEGFIESRPRQGFYVAALPDSYGRFTMSDPKATTGHPEKDYSTAVTYAYDFHLAKNDFTSFPVSHWKRLLMQTLREEYDELLFYGDPQGEAGLRGELAAYLSRIRGVVCRKEQIVIGAEQHLLLHYLAILLKGISPAVAVEDPCYPLIARTFQAEGFAVLTASEAEKGIDISRMVKASARIVAVAPSHQFPGGRVMPINERMELLKWAKEQEGYIIEDDYGGELRYLGQPVPALQGLAPDANVIYVGGFSQILAPDICIHYMVLPESLLAPYLQLRRRLLFEQSSSRVYQRTLEKLMRQGYFERHVRKMRSLYRRKNQELAEALQMQFRDCGEVHNPHAGFHLILSLNAEASEQEMIQAAKSGGIRVASASAFYADQAACEREKRKRFLIGFGGIAGQRIKEGASQLRQLWEPYLHV